MLTANRKKATREDCKKEDDEIHTNVIIKSDESEDECPVQQSTNVRPIVEGIPGGTSSEPAAMCSSSYIRGGCELHFAYKPFWNLS